MADSFTLTPQRDQATSFPTKADAITAGALLNAAHDYRFMFELREYRGEGWYVVAESKAGDQDGGWIVREAAPDLRAVESCIAWAAQHGYTGATLAATQLGAVTGREMFEDQPYYGSHAWRPKS